MSHSRRSQNFHISRENNACMTESGRFYWKYRADKHWTPCCPSIGRLGADDVYTIAKMISQQHFPSRGCTSHLASPLNISVNAQPY
jgi:hypothetical protein